MFARIFSCWSVFVLANAVPLAAQEEPVDRKVLQPTSKWVLDYAESRCRIGRTFGSDEEQSILWFEQVQPSAAFTWMAAGEDIGKLGKMKMNVRFGPGFHAFESEIDRRMELPSYGQAFSGSGVVAPISEDEKKAAAEKDLSPKLAILDPDQGAAIDWVEFSRSQRAVRFETGNLKQVYAALNSCMDNLLTHWGVDPAVQRTVAKMPSIKNLQAVARRIQKVYPAKAFSKGEQANFHFRVMIDETGRPTACKLTSLTSAENFDVSACDEFLEHAKFDPAINFAGQPTPSYYSGDLKYRLN
ncbi:MAG: hypothetical protein DI637_07480 [Citromicrobium sp.]|nr:MAG: hypothetical protein DI637_07480 [Citromicrobium sp.]